MADTVLVTGASGLLGSWVIRSLLASGFAVTPTDQGEVSGLALPQETLARFELGDLTDEAFCDRLLRANTYSGVVHCAALLQAACEPNPHAALRVNVQATWNVLQAAKTHGVGRIVFPSTAAVYGSTESEVAEDAALFHNGPNLGVYAASKWFAERLGLAFRIHQHGPQFVGFRVGVVFGLAHRPSTGFSSVVQRLYRSLLLGEDVRLSEGAAGSRMHFVHLTEIGRAVIAALRVERDPTGIYNLVGPRSNYTSLSRFAEAVQASAGTSSSYSFDGPLVRAPRQSMALAARELGFEPAVTLSAAVALDLPELSRTL